jgi:hypothetical protein
MKKLITKLIKAPKLHANRVWCATVFLQEVFIKSQNEYCHEYKSMLKCHLELEYGQLKDKQFNSILNDVARLLNDNLGLKLLITKNFIIMGK